MAALPKLRKGQIFQLKDGKTYRFKGEDGEPLHQGNIEVFYDPEAAKVKQYQPEAPSKWVSLGRGVMDMGQGINQLARRAFGDEEETAAYEAEKNAENQLYEQGRGPDAGFDWWRLGGQVGAAAPLGLFGGAAATTGTLGRAAIGSTLGAAEGGLQYVDTSEGDFATNKAINTGLGAVGGMFGGLLAPGAVKIGDKLSGPAKVIWKSLRPDQQGELIGQLQAAAEAAGTRWDDMGEALQAEALDAATKQLSVQGELDADAIIRATRMKRVGFEEGAGPMRAQVTADPVDYDEMQSLMSSPEGMPARLRQRAQNDLAHRGVQNTIAALSQGRPIGKEVFTGDTLQRALPGSEVPYAVQRTVRGMERASQREVRNAYNQAKQAPGLSSLAPNFQRLNERVTEVFNDFPAGVREQLPKRVLDLVDGVLTPSVDNIIDSFKNVNRLASKTTDAQIGEFYGQIGRALHSTLDEIANDGSEAAQALLKANRLAAIRFGVLKGSGRDKLKTITALADGDLKMSNFVSNRVIGGDAHEIEGLRRFLTEFPEEFSRVPRQAGQKAWDQIRSSVMEELGKKAKMGESAWNEFNGRAFKDAWDNLGTMKQRALFTDSEISFINDIAAATRDLTASPSGKKLYSKSDSSTWLKNIIQTLWSKGGPLGVLVRKIGEAPEDAAKAKATRQLSKRAMSGDPVSADALDRYLRKGSGVIGVSSGAAGGAGSKGFADQYR